MPATNMASVQEALKLFYLDGLMYQLNNASPVLSRIERDSTSVVGSEIRMALRYGRHGGIGNRTDDGDMPIPRSRQTKQAKWETKNIFAQIQISDKTVKASRSNLGAFANLLEADLEDAVTDAKDDLSRQVFGDGTGKLAAFADTTAGATQEMDNVQYLVEGMFVDVVDSSGDIQTEKLEVLAVDEDTNEVTLSASVTPSAGDILVRHGNYDMELTGFGAVFEKDNTLYGIDRTQNKWFNPTIIEVNGEIDEVTLQKGEDEVDRKAGGRITMLSSSYGVRRAYQNLLLATKNIVEVMQLEGGWDALSYNNKPFTADKYAPAGTIYGIDESTWRMYQMGDWDWLDDDGAVLSRVPGKAVWSAILARYCDLGCNKPRANYIMTGITEH